LEHEALPAKDFQRIRSNAADLVRRGEAIVRVGVPKRTAENSREDFRKELKKFKSALSKLRRDAKRGTDAQLENSFSAVHDSFEMLVGMLPRK
jgi:predicted phage gp36 major capsid-like protein